ncbi:Relaxase/Mobilisation nuclease domain-containing protein [Pseudooceanicola nitratireducens]|uniref:Relaxase/Mobilisation nuclease domain-containing protein n=1 Tax=Pseudooceanicola nitratireducens TaxID=517719 RepID=A0A1I1LW49_9RHOB|nr:relaxase/mobilization nuclease domain-containing protein [Pseudooceanicola nitratireducens]SEJ66199.1 Relaxase/Mobilisation nuclease domain-containing protein [Pseudooceanicola nitratireducens]SFC76712.1 Relaxase/Mobilisation nuclease domain-containing protein [Pseudooceanicola nitratireducens]
MILKGSQRGNAAKLARHLMNVQDNEHVELHELRGFVSDEQLLDALLEAQAVAKGTRCQQHLFSLSLNPPEGERVDVATFEAAIELAEQRLGLDGHARAIVFHEKEGRRHAHAVWSRIDVETMTAKNLPFFKRRLMEVSKELYLQNGWDMPKGIVDQAVRNPLNFTRAEWQQAKRAMADPRLVKAAFKQAWESSDNADTLKAALEEKGYFLARGDRRGVVAVDYQGEIYALARWSGVKTKDVKARIHDADNLPSVQERREEIAKRVSGQLVKYVLEINRTYSEKHPTIEFKRTQAVERHREERKLLDEMQRIRWDKETAARAARLPKGVSGLWSRITGKYSKIRTQNELETWQSYMRDQAERDDLVARQLDERQQLQRAIKQMREKRSQDIADLHGEMSAYLSMQRGHAATAKVKSDHAKQQETKNKDKTRGRPRDQGPDFNL